MPVVSELVRQQTILYHSDSRSIPDRIVSLCQAHIRLILRGKARCNVEFGVKILISVTGEGFTFLDRLSYDPYNEREDLKAQAIAYWRRHGQYPKVTCADQIYRTRSNRAFRKDNQHCSCFFSVLADCVWMKNQHKKGPTDVEPWVFLES
jgi:IS5 family transposase